MIVEAVAVEDLRAGHPVEAARTRSSRNKNAAANSSISARPRRRAQEVVRVVARRDARRTPRRSISGRPRISSSCWGLCVATRRLCHPGRRDLEIERARRGGSRRVRIDLPASATYGARCAARRRPRSACRRTARASRRRRGPSSPPAIRARPTGPRPRRRRVRGDTRAGDRAAGAPRRCRATRAARDRAGAAGRAPTPRSRRRSRSRGSASAR